jgi:hypothetical protein
MGLGRLVAPPKEHLAQDEAISRDPDFHNVYLDISWDEIAKYFVTSPEATKGLADLIQRYPDRFLFGSDAAAPADQSKYLKVFYQYEPLWKLSTRKRTNLRWSARQSSKLVECSFAKCQFKLSIQQSIPEGTR